MGGKPSAGRGVYVTVLADITGNCGSETGSTAFTALACRRARKAFVAWVAADEITSCRALSSLGGGDAAGDSSKFERVLPSACDSRSPGSRTGVLGLVSRSGHFSQPTLAPPLLSPTTIGAF